MKHITIILLLALSLLAEDKISLKTIASSSNYSVGDTAIFAIEIKIPKQFHLYANPLGTGIGLPIKITPVSTKGITWLDAKEQEPSKYVQDGPDSLWVWQWGGTAYLFARGVIDSTNSGKFGAQIAVSGLICKTSCIAQYDTVTISTSIGKMSRKLFIGKKKIRAIYKKALPMNFETVFTVENSTQEDNKEPLIDSNENKSYENINWVYVAQENGRSFNIFMAIILAFIAGIILNFMPCVLPVLGIKILAFSEGRAESKATAVKNSLSFAGGMITVFMILGTMAAFAGMSWGEQFQSPLFIIVLVSIMFVFGLGMFDLFIILVPNKISELDSKQDNHGIWGNFLKGMFATVLATPCSGPFLGATLAWTLTQSNLIVYVVFFSLGLGMSSPYILLAASKRLSSIIPKPGAWMEDFKHILGFFLFGFAVYLMIGLPRDMVLPTTAFMVVVAASVMLYLRLAPFGSGIIKKIRSLFFAILLLWGGYYLSFVTMYGMISEENGTRIENSSKVKWEKFSVAELFKANNNGQTVVMDFTANWCMNCQFNKINVYHTSEIEDIIIDKGILPIKADLTNDNKVIESLRSHLGSESVPFLAIFPGNDYEHPIVMRDLVSKKDLVEVLNRMPKYDKK